jgi:hypothetical protein
MNPSDAAAQQRTASPELAGSERRQLVEALLAAFDDDGLEQVARFHLDVDLAEVAGGDNLRDVAFNLVEWATREGRTAALVDGALAENPGSPDLRRFELDVWNRPRPKERPARSGETARAAAGGAAEAAPPREAPWWKKHLAPLVIVAIGAGGLVLLWRFFAGGPPPEIVVANAALAQVRTDAELGEVFDVSFDYSLTNLQGKTVRVQGAVLDADSRRPVPLSTPPRPIDITPSEQSVKAEATIAVPFPWERGCIVVRVAATDAGGEELSTAETPAFDPYDLTNPACPQRVATSVQLSSTSIRASGGLWGWG